MLQKPRAQALTGPIARGDTALVSQQLHALEHDAPQMAALYQALGKPTLQLSRELGQADSDQLDAIEQLLQAR